MDNTSIISNLFHCPDRNSTVFVRLSLFAIAGCFLLIACPGFYSYDELVKFDHVHQFGFASYLKTYINMNAGTEFAFTVRPLAFFIQGVMAFFSENYPVVVHLTDVLMHVAVALLLFVTLTRLQVERRVAWVAALVFIINPLVTFAVGWEAALMDRMYVLFGLLAFLQADKYIREQSGNLSLLLVFVWSVLALISKETALIFAFTLAVYPLFMGVSWKNKRLWTVFAVWMVPILPILGYRLQELLASYGNTTTPYSTSFSSFPENVFIYFIYPLLPNVAESHNWFLQSKVFIGLAVIAHLAVAAMLWLKFSYRATLAYLAGYLLFLLPVAFLPFTASHYLYGSGLPFSVAIAMLAFMPGKFNHRLIPATVAVVMLFAGWHALTNQIFFYDTGTCMSRLNSTLESTHLSDGQPDTMIISPQPASPGYVLVRFINSRNRVGEFSPVNLQLVDWEKRHEVKDGNYYIMECDCNVHKPAAFSVLPNAWGPQTLAVNEVPIPQPDGNGAFWIMVQNTNSLSNNVQVVLGGQPAVATSVQEKVITATFPPSLFTQAGEKEILVRDVTKGKDYSVGKLVIK